MHNKYLITVGVPPPRGSVAGAPPPFPWDWVSQNHRIVGVGRDLCGSPSPTPCRSRVTHSRLHRTLSRWVLNISREGDSTASLGSLGQGSVTLTGKKFFLMFPVAPQWGSGGPPEQAAAQGLCPQGCWGTPGCPVQEPGHWAGASPPPQSRPGRGARIQRSPSAAPRPASSAGSDLESRDRRRPRLPVPLMHRAGAERRRWGQQPLGQGHRLCASLHRADASGLVGQ